MIAVGIFAPFRLRLIHKTLRWLRRSISSKCRPSQRGTFVLFMISPGVHFTPSGGGVLPNKEVRGLGPHIKFGGKICGKVRPSSPNKRKSLGSSITTRRKSWEEVPILGSYLKFRGQNLGCLSLIFLEAKFRSPTKISEANFGAKPPTS